PNKEGIVNKGLMCGKGKFGFDCCEMEGKLLEPVIKRGSLFEETDYHEAFVTTAKKLQKIAAKYGKDKVGISISDRFTNEEAYAMKKLANLIGARTFCFNHRDSGIAKVLGFDGSPNTIDELLATEVILVSGFSIVLNPVMGIKLAQAAKNGAKVIVVNPSEFQGHFDYAEKVVYTENNVDFLKQIAKKLCEMKPGKSEDFAAFEASLKGITVTKDAEEIAQLYGKAKKAMIVFQQNFVTTDAATLLADIAVVSGHIGSPRNGILQIKPKNNSQGLVDLGIRTGAEALDGLKALLIFGEDPKVDLSGLEFLAVVDTHMTETAKKAAVVFPGTGFASADGTFTNTERRLMPVEAAISEEVSFNNWEVATEIAHVYEEDMGFEDSYDISNEMDDQLLKYRYAEVGEVFGDVLTPESTTLVPVDSITFVDPLDCTDHLMNMIAERLPKPV
ncbi:MAG: molybdopterin-dependent oxidoreductase, partial [Anaerovorax sp.]